jgi:hypothetical protein
MNKKIPKKNIEKERKGESKLYRGKTQLKGL